MKIEIVFPRGNEEKFTSLGKELGFDKLIFVYDDLKKVKKVDSLIKIQYCVLAADKNKNDLVKKIHKIKDKGFLVLIKCLSDEMTRFVLEQTRADMVFGLEEIHKKDKTHYRKGGLDQVLCKIAAEKKKTIVFLIKDDPLSLGRTIQNLRFCKKYGVKTLLSVFAKQPEDMKSAHDLDKFKQLLQQKFL